MVLSYKGFLQINEANIKKGKLKRADLKVGDDVMTIGSYEGVDLDYMVGKIIFMRDYGKILIEFEKKFHPALHSGQNNIGKSKHCYYVDFNNIQSNKREDFEKTIKNVGSKKLEETNKLNMFYKEGDVVVGVGIIKDYNHKNISIDGEIGIIYYNTSYHNQNDKGKNSNYLVGFVDSFSNFPKNLNVFGPLNNAALNVDKLHLRHITDEEREKFKDKLNPFIEEYESMTSPLKNGDIITIIRDYNNFGIIGQQGVIADCPKINPMYGIRNVTLNVCMVNKEVIPQMYLQTSVGMMLYRYSMRLATPEEIKKVENKIALVKADIAEYNHPYKVGDWILAKKVLGDNSFDNQPGKIMKIEGNKPYDNFHVSFLANFSNRLRKMDKWDNCTILNRINITLCKDPKMDELIKKVENNELISFQASSILNMVMDRTGIKCSIPFFTQAYFDISEKCEITFLPLNKISRLEPGEDPFKSRFRQIMGVGKFIRLVQPGISERPLELFTNSFKANFDIVNGATDKLRLVSGEDVRYWYCEDQYVKGGGTLNSSCMKGREKAKEMQMFVDNPDEIQLLILTDDNSKLLGRALIWRLVVPKGNTYMDHVYTRYEKDREIFLMYAASNNWLTADRNRYTAGTMICALFNGKKYRQGVDALDHFDSLHIGHTGDYLTNSNNWTRPDSLVKKNADGTPYIPAPIEPKVKPQKKGPVPILKGDEDLPFPLNTKVIYQKKGRVNDGKEGIFIGLREDGKAKVVFDDGGKYALLIDYLKEVK